MHYLSLENFYKLHHVFAHFGFALAALLFLAAHTTGLEEKVKEKLMRWGGLAFAGGTLLLCATGLGLALTNAMLQPVHYVHGALGVVMYLCAAYICYRRDARIWVKMTRFCMAGVSLTIVLGVFSAFGPRYFFSQLPGFRVLDNSAEVRLYMEVLRPIFDKKCTKCHNAEIASGKLNFYDLKSFNDIYKDENPSHISTLTLRLTESVFSEHHMPRFAGHLSESELSDIRHWASNGGVAPGAPVSNPKAVTDPRIRRWPFMSFPKPMVPRSDDTALVKNEIDAFVLRSLASHGKSSLQPLAPEILARRLSLVLTGLPQHLGDATKPFETLKKEAMSSLGFAENFALYWMDLAGFADDDGPDPDENHRVTTQAYRTYILDSFKGQPSYFNLLHEQISAPLGYKNPRSLLNYTPYNDLEDITLDSAMSTVFSFTLGIQMRCARCHDHPNEPISNENYYQLAYGFTPEYTFAQPPQYLMRKNNQAAPKPRFLGIYDGADPDRAFSDIKSMADWMTNTQNGVGFFTARVFVDHIWRFVFGQGLVVEAANFGSTSPEPENLELLNWLTYDFIEHGTSIRYLVDKLVSSQTFASRVITGGKEAPAAQQIFQSRLMSTENIRDNLLTVAHMLKEATQDNVTIMHDLRDLASVDENNRRTFYMFRTRWATDDERIALVEHFGLPKKFTSTPTREEPTSMYTGLFFLSPEKLMPVLANLQQQVKGEETNVTPEMVTEAYRAILFRDPKPDELSIWQQTSLQYLNKYNLLHMLLTSNEFLYIP